MKRRHFVCATAGAVAAQFLDPRRARGQAVDPMPVPRTSRLFAGPAASLKVGIQYIVADRNRILCLVNDREKREATITATNPDGETLWKYSLPRGMYLSLGTDGPAVVVQSFNSLMEFLPPTGELRSVGSLGKTVAGTRLLEYAGDSCFFRVAAGRGEIWSVRGGIVRKDKEFAADGVPPDALAAAVSPAELALVPTDGSGLFRVAIPAGTITRQPLASDEVKRRREESQIGEGGGQGGLMVVLATGGGEMGILYVMLAPLGGFIAPVLRIDSGGAVSTWKKLLLAPRAVPMKLIASGAEIGVAHHNGSVAWYPV
jgi:hypothetical protein